jgi:hypothetical protein
LHDRIATDWTLQPERALLSSSQRAAGGTPRLEFGASGRDGAISAPDLEPSMTTLSDTQLILLSAAAARDDHRVILPDRLRGGAADRVLSSLQLKGLIEPFAGEEEGRTGFAIRDLARTGYRISRAGRIAIHAESDDLSIDAGIAKSAAFESDRHAGPSPDLNALSAKFPASAPPLPTRRDAGPRSGSKISTVVDLLARPDGASVDELIAATGWLPHTTRATLSILRRKGFPISRIGNGPPASYRLDGSMGSAPPMAKAAR